ncbi:Uncharacterised protein [Salmonella enterica subsp. enterica serovar Bovismorbificans]|uniref:Uncharacterized protein n=1 Tax=Salmonella enterica subsp. enterica serovar Bovismorbificans TaxID=58097 RepID=A0A655DK13_SALET|nr:Uncharacterised protein [Salmonella enterica subsp. enterica serovar Bovismorbificans]
MMTMLFRRPNASASRPATGTITPKPITAIISIHSISLRGKPSPTGAAAVL